MANVIGSMLVGVGVEFDKKSADQVQSGFDSIKSKALQLGAVLGGAFGLKSLTFGFAQGADEIGKFSETYGLLAEDVKALGGVFQLQGGSLQSFMAQVTAFEQQRARLVAGDAGFIQELGIAGIDAQPLIEAENSIEAMLRLSEQFSELDKSRQLLAANTLGIDQAGILVLRQGRSEIQGQIAEQKKLFTLTQEMVDKSAEFNNEWSKAKTRFEGIGAVISDNILLPITKAVNQSKFLDPKAVERAIVDDPKRAAVSAGFDFLSNLFGDNDDDIATQVMRANRIGTGPSGSLIPSEIDNPTNRVSASAIPSETDNSANRDITINANLLLDGRVIDNRIIKVNEAANGETLQNLTSTTAR